MKKVLHISKYYYPFSGGTEQIARDCVLSLKNSFEQKVIAFNDSKNDQIDDIDGVEVIKCGCFSIISSQPLSFSYKQRLNDIMRDFKPNIIIFHYPNPFVGMLLLKELKKRKTKLILYWHLDIIHQKFLRVFFIEQNRKLLERADKVIATSPNYIEGSKWLQSAKNKCVVIPNCINSNRMKITSEIEERAEEIRTENKSRLICVAVGRHTKYKGFSYLIKASKLLDETFRIFIVGEGELTNKLHKEAENNDRIVFTGRIDDLELKSLIFASDIFCFPSITKNEAFGLALAEAMYYEKPAVTFTIPGSGVNYVCLNRKNGIEVPNRDIVAYANALKELANNSQLRKNYGVNGKQRVVDNFLDNKFKNKIFIVVNEVAENV